MRNLNLQTKLVGVVLAPAALLLIIGVAGLFLAGAVPLGIAALCGSVICAVIGYSVVSPTLRAARIVKAAAKNLADEKLPQMASGEDSAFGFEQLSIAPTGDMEFDEIARALERIYSHSTSSFYEQQARVRDGLSKVVVNLARRNQNLLDRQIDLIDDMEESEQNPERLDGLFKLDHMTTRMKRNQESLLVLADAESPRRRSGTVDIEDILRVAMSEIEEYQRIETGQLVSTNVQGTVAGDLAHMLSELFENACAFSPPDTNVKVNGEVSDVGSYVLSITDEGLGMEDEQLNTANKMLLEPPDIGLNMGRTLGFAVVGKLAERLEIDVTLIKNPVGKGTTAIVEIPPASLAGSEEDVLDTPEEAPVEAAKSATPVADTTPDRPAPISDPLARFRQDESQLSKLLGGSPAREPISESNPVVPSESPFAEEPATWTPPVVKPRGPDKLAEAIPSGEAFDDGLTGLLDETPKTEKPSLAKRVPGSGSGPSTLDRRRPDGDPPDQNSTKKPVSKASARDPEEIRKMLSRYRDGIKGKGQE